MAQGLYISLILSDLVIPNNKSYNQIMYNLYAKYVIILEICKQFSDNLVNDKGMSDKSISCWVKLEKG